MLKKLFAISLIFITATEINAMTFENKIAVKHGLFGILPVVDHRADIRVYNNYCKAKGKSPDDLDFLATTCADMCFKFEENSPDHFSRAEAEVLLQSVSRNPVAASAMKVLSSQYLWYHKSADALPKCEITKSRDDTCCYRRGAQSDEHYIGDQKINLRPDWENETEKPFAFFNIDDKQSTDFNRISLKRQFTHEMMHFMDAVLVEDGIRNKGDIPIIQKIGLDFLSRDTLKQNLQQNLANIEEANKSIEGLGLSLHQSLHGVYDDMAEMWGMYGLPCLSWSIHSGKVYYDGENVVQSEPGMIGYQFAYEPVNDGASYMYGFDKDDDLVGKVRVQHRKDIKILPVAPILEEHFHIYSFYKQKDVLEAFKFSTTVVEEA